MRWVHPYFSFAQVMAVVLSRRVDFPMVDMAGIVYYPQYWDLCHRFFEESWSEIVGIDYPTLLKEHSIGLPAVHTECDYLAPLTYGDTVHCTLWIEKVGESSVTWRYEYYNQHQKLVWTATVVTVCIKMDSYEKISVPDFVRTGRLACQPLEE